MDDGNAYVTGFTESTDFPTANPLQASHSGGTRDVFVTKLSADGSQLLYSTYLGGSGGDEAYGIDVDSFGSAYLTGVTRSSDFPTANPFDSSYFGTGDAFVTKLSPDGSALVYSTYLGGYRSDVGGGIAVDDDGNAYVAGGTGSNVPSDGPSFAFPTTPGAFQPNFGGGNTNAFATKLSADGDTLVYSSFLGGSDSEGGNAIAVDAGGDAYVAGITISSNFPTVNPVQPTRAGVHDTFVAKITDDTTPPTTTATPSPAPNANGWNNSDVTVTLEATDEDGGSGVKEIAYSAAGAQTISETTEPGDSVEVPITTEGETEITFFATDNAGNVEDSQTFTVRLDKSAPTVECGSADGLWHASDVSIDCAANDDVSGLADTSNDSFFQLSTNVPEGTETANAETDSREVCDVADNCETAGPIGGNKVDKKAPEVTITAPPDGAEYLLGETVAADYDCSDGGSGVASCAGSVASGSDIDTASVGQKTFTVEATDEVGNTASGSHAYSVLYDFEGFFAPVNNPPTLNEVKAGSAIPVKFSLSGDQGLDIFAEGYPKSQQISCDSTAPTDGIEQTVTAGESSLSYSAGADQYNYVWKTSKDWSGTCRQLVVKLDDGTFHRANFKFR